MTLNLDIFNLVHSLAGRWGILDRVGIFFAEYAVYLVILVFLFFFVFGFQLSRERATFFAQSVLAFTISFGVILGVAHEFFYLARPFVELGFAPLVYGQQSSAFPSGHAMAVFMLSALIFSRHRKLGIALFLVSAIIGVARVFAGVHWPLDIIGGAVFGAGSAFFSYKLIYGTKQKSVDSAVISKTEK